MWNRLRRIPLLYESHGVNNLPFVVGAVGLPKFQESCEHINGSFHNILHLWVSNMTVLWMAIALRTNFAAMYVFDWSRSKGQEHKSQSLNCRPFRYFLHLVALNYRGA